jgi:hypothetical protein
MRDLLHTAIRIHPLRRQRLLISAVCRLQFRSRGSRLEYPRHSVANYKR